MDEEHNPAVVQAVMRHARMDMTLYYSHSSTKAKRAAVDSIAAQLAPEAVRVRHAGAESQAVNKTVN